MLHIIDVWKRRQAKTTLRFYGIEHAINSLFIISDGFWLSRRLKYKQFIVKLISRQYFIVSINVNVTFLVKTSRCVIYKSLVCRKRGLLYSFRGNYSLTFFFSFLTFRFLSLTNFNHNRTRKSLSTFQSIFYVAQYHDFASNHVFEFINRIKLNVLEKNG